MAKYIIALTDHERDELRANLRTRKSGTTIYRRSQMLLAMDKNGDKSWNDTQITEAYGVSRRQCINLRQSLCEHGLHTALNGKKYKRNAPGKFDASVEAHLIALRCSDPPAGHGKWTLRLLADEMIKLEYVDSISHEGVRMLLKKTRLSPGKSNLG
jgi:transposase